MKISVSDIKPEGSEVKCQISNEIIGKTEVLEFIEPVKVIAKVERIDEEVIAETVVSGKYSAVCSRCLEEFEQLWEKNFLIGIEIDRRTEYIDLGEEIRQEVILNLPTKVLCDKDCKGLCPNCGKNLNNEKCKCSSMS
ncbi:MAG: hypothetical protein A2Y03_03560 [Omnitrophica WOR_2 bacterium GWF2_38_59]|nr:MAG: hypothetical protein A2Y03_03560 [Omnitrophica WOR_2 bacterium GWF2_38_59]OGX57106.1 MAG: hypothetical protein A2306_00930 [Omnitrophica WOR_2 bacterium RIFOXYB2_FULL_38_16]OGX59428.1 MAG: hypothetical protein A2447_04890 [Omnitrophica WOR_2 bacterium RIFOXYC2_FULL_38_12]HBG60569.1 hypothetical protein [Candidatus Omnitrophota bacterium]